MCSLTFTFLKTNINLHFCFMNLLVKPFIIFLTVTIFAPVISIAQSSYVPLGSNSIYLLDRFEIKSGKLAEPTEFNSTSKLYKRASIAQYVDSFNVSRTALSKQDYFNLDYLQNDNFEWSNSENTKSSKSILSSKIYKHKAAFADYSSKEFNIVVNPITYQQFGYDTRLKEMVSLQCSGIEVRGSIKGSVSFYTQITDEVIHTNSWVRDFYQKDSVIPGAGYLKSNDSKTFNYNLASGYISFQASKHIDIQFGHGKNFIGNGYRTFYLSDFSTNHLFLRLNTRFWKINYTNIFGEILNYQQPHEAYLPKWHYYAATHASINLTKNFNLGLFQTIVFQRDSGYSNGSYDPQYLNPVIFYKPIENGLNSPDKAILGVDFKYNFLKHFSLYGQAVISEFILSEIIANNGSIANKQAYQLGIKCIDILDISTLDLQLEYNQANPYMYTSFNRLNSYINYNQNMAHPIGANLRELIGVLRYQPINRMTIKLTGIYTTYGNDTGQSNYGKNIALSYYNNTHEYGNFIGQGVLTHLYIFDLTVSHMLKHNLFLEFKATYRKVSSVGGIFDSETFSPTLGVRWNIGERRWDF